MEIKDKHMEKEVDKLVKNLEVKRKITPPFQKFQHHPDARMHQIISFIKSGVRIIGYFFIPFSLVTATALLILSEVVGIIEELV